MKNVNLKNLVQWLDDLKEAAKEDQSFSIAWFKETETSPFSIIGGWMSGFSETWDNLLCVSKSNSQYAMCVKIAVNEGPYAYTDFEAMDMPVNEDGEVDDNCIALEYGDNTEELAFFLLNEWEKLMEEHEEVLA
jgi:hypothetical protein